MRHRARRSLHAIFGGALLFGLLVLVESGLEIVQATDYCPRCTARSTVRRISLFGVRGENGRQIASGPIARFLEKHLGQACAHEWLLASATGGGILLRWQWSGEGQEPDRQARQLEHDPALVALLEAELSKDPEYFIVRLLSAIHTGSELSCCLLFDDLDQCVAGLEMA